MQELALRWLGGLSTQILGTWIGSRGSTCHCSFDHDAALLGVLKAQLDRCGPEQLTSPPAIPCPGPSGWLFVAVGLLCVLSFICGVVVALLLAFRTPKFFPTLTEPAALTDLDDHISTPRRPGARLLR